MSRGRVAIASLAVAALATAAGCPGPAPSPPETPSAEPSPAAETPTSQPAAASERAEEDLLVVGPVREAHAAAQYTYFAVQGPQGLVWSAAPQFPIRLGDVVRVHAGLPMPNFHSDTLDRTFELVHFVERVELEERATPLLLGDLLAERKRFAGAVVTTFGRVDRVTLGVLGANWAHLTDGAGNELTVTTLSEPVRGKLVKARGRLLLDRDFGHGYQYASLLGEAQLSEVEAIPDLKAEAAPVGTATPTQGE